MKHCPPIRFAALTLLASVAFSISARSQTTKFKDDRWYDNKKYGTKFYDHPVIEPAEVILTPERLEAHLGSQNFSYAIKKVEEMPKKFLTEYTVEDGDGKQSSIVVRKGGATRDGRDRIMIWATDWILLTALTNIDPQGYQFPGDPKINLTEARADIVGYYEIMGYGNELAQCLRDMKVDLLPDNSGSWWAGMAEGCTKSEMAYKWKLDEVVVGGKRVLMLFFVAGLDSQEFKVTEITRKRLLLRGEFRSGDSTAPVDIELFKTKKK
jgi:hypothetical protein